MDAHWDMTSNEGQFVRLAMTMYDSNLYMHINFFKLKQSNWYRANQVSLTLDELLSQTSLTGAPRDQQDLSPTYQRFREDFEGTLARLIGSADLHSEENCSGGDDQADKFIVNQSQEDIGSELFDEIWATEVKFKTPPKNPRCRHAQIV